MSPVTVAAMLVVLRRRLGVRLRSALAAAVVVAVASLLAGAVLLVIARGILLGNVNTAAMGRATQVAATLKSDAEDAVDDGTGAVVVVASLGGLPLLTL